MIPINFNLRSDLEKESILNSYKIFLKTCDFDIQILVQSNKEDLSKHFLKIKEKTNNEENEIISISQEYIKYIENLNSKKNSSSKNYFILVKNSQIKINDLNEKFYIIKECLSRCGNSVSEITEKSEIINVLSSFFNKY